MQQFGFQAPPKPHHLDRMLDDEAAGTKGKGRNKGNSGKGPTQDIDWPPARLMMPEDL